MNDLGPWIIFGALIVLLLGMDLLVFNRRPHAMGFREAAGWSAFWVALSLAFNLGIYWHYGAEAALQFFTSYLLENSLSADNVFLFALIFASMGVAAEYQHRVLFWGFWCALVLRGSFILAGVELVKHFHAILYVFAAFLVVMGVRLVRAGEKQYGPASSRVAHWARKLFPISEHFDGGRLFTRGPDGRRYATPLLLVLIMIEVVDVTFALDSLPAIFSVTQNAFIIFTSNVFAILGLRSLYFLLARAMARFHYLRAALAIILMLVGARMLVAHWVRIPTGWALAGIVAILGAAMVASAATQGKRAA
jgi:tellurite resistance protein TerC